MARCAFWRVSVLAESSTRKARPAQPRTEQARGLGWPAAAVCAAACISDSPRENLGRGHPPCVDLLSRTSESDVLQNPFNHVEL